MLKLIKDLDDDELTWIVVSEEQRGNWCESIEEALESHAYNLRNEGYEGEDPRIQDNIETVAEGSDPNELRLEVLLNG